MFWTAFVYGVGGSMGGAIGLLFFVLVYQMVHQFAKSDTAKVIESLDARCLQALETRNELTTQTIVQLESIASRIGEEGGK